MSFASSQIYDERFRSRDVKLEFFIGYLLNSILPGEVFYLSTQHLYTIQMGGTDIFKMVNFVPQKNAFIFQGNHTDENNNGESDKPKEEQEIGNWLVLFRAAGSQILSATLSLALRERELFSTSAFPEVTAFRVKTFSEATVLQVHTG